MSLLPALKVLGQGRVGMGLELGGQAKVQLGWIVGTTTGERFGDQISGFLSPLPFAIDRANTDAKTQAATPLLISEVTALSTCVRRSRE